MGPDTGGAVGALFCDDHTHLSSVGAPQIATLVAGAIDRDAVPAAG